MSDDAEKYPFKIQKLFTPKLPFIYKAPTDYAPESRATSRITPLKDFRSISEQYKQEFFKPKEPQDATPKPQTETHAESFARQLKEWEDAEVFAANEYLRDPNRTVFVARLYYTMTEMDLSKNFNRFGSIESIRIARDIKSGKSRGYGFIVFERRVDASNCIQELAPTGLAVDPPDASTKPRKILVDMECGRLVRTWKPMRLGGGLGGRHYTIPSPYHFKDASSASSGRRPNLSSNPYQSYSSHSDRQSKRSYSDRYTSSYPNKRLALNSTNNPQKSAVPQSYSSYSPASTSHTTASARSSDASIKDKYAKYSSPVSSTGSETNTRSIRSIRRS